MMKTIESNPLINKQQTHDSFHTIKKLKKL